MTVSEAQSACPLLHEVAELGPGNTGLQVGEITLERSDPKIRCIRLRTKAITTVLDAKSFSHPTEGGRLSLNCKSALGRAGGAKLLLAFGFALGLPQSLRALPIFLPMPCLCVCVCKPPQINFELDAIDTRYSTLSDLKIN